MFRRPRKRSWTRRIPATNKPPGEGGDSQAVFRKHKPDYWLVIVSFTLLLIGIVVVYSISPGLAAAQGVSEHYYVTKQLIALSLGVAGFIFFSSLPLNTIKRFTKSLIWLSLLMIVAVQVFGQEANGAYRWIQVGGFSFQVAELVKFTLIVWLAGFLVERLAKDEIESSEKTLKPLVILVGLIGILIAGLESDLGSAGVMIAIVAVMGFSAGLPLKKIGIIAGIILILTTLAISTTPYRRDRLASFLSPAKDCQSEGYQSCQALIAVGSGGIFGLGLANGVQAYGYLPEAENDSIFAILGEKFGFIGTSAVIGLYAVLFARMRRTILRTADSFSRLVVIGVLAWLSTQTIINIGAMIGLLPLKGITLPLVSYGGTSLVFIMAALGVVFQISRYTSYSTIRNVSVSTRKGGAVESPIGRRGQRRPYYASPGNR
ncbi:MAG TPA: putative lipid II flippase FtsW [Candidatus Saccharimonadales bacterium]|nr:putative lipid II flippase FtsW [Candidatus Saccharimonadales bacterium]